MLLGRWMDLARASAALPPDDRWRVSVPAVIGLQAVSCALAESLELPTSERLLGVDRGAVLIRRHVAQLNDTWRGEPMPERLTELIADARAAWNVAAEAGVEWVVAVERLEMPDVAAHLEGAMGDVLAAPPGTILFRGSPAVFARPETIEFNVHGLTRGEVGPPRQVYRRGGTDPCDIVAPMLTALPAGRPLLVWMVRDGERQAIPESQQAPVAPDLVLPVVEWDENEEISGPAM